MVPAQLEDEAVSTTPICESNGHYSSVDAACGMPFFSTSKDYDLAA